MFELLKRLFSVPDDEEKAQMAAQRELSVHRCPTTNCEVIPIHEPERSSVSCTYCEKDIPEMEFPEHRGTCVAKTGGFDHRH